MTKRSSLIPFLKQLRLYYVGVPFLAIAARPALWLECHSPVPDDQFARQCEPSTGFRFVSRTNSNDSKGVSEHCPWSVDLPQR